MKITSVLPYPPQMHKIALPQHYYEGVPSHTTFNPINKSRISLGYGIYIIYTYVKTVGQISNIVVNMITLLSVKHTIEQLISIWQWKHNRGVNFYQGKTLSFNHSKMSRAPKPWLCMIILLAARPILSLDTLLHLIPY